MLSGHATLTPSLLRAVKSSLTLQSSMRPAKREMEQSILKMGRRGYVHIAQCRGFVTYGSNHWILPT